jgi:uncharacterized protein
MRPPAAEPQQAPVVPRRAPPRSDIDLVTLRGRRRIARPRVLDVDITIVGSGPAGLAAATTLAKEAPHARVVVLEAGRDLEARPCPVDMGRRCRGCGGTCNVVSGFGGCLHYGDAAKLSLVPSGRRLLEKYGDEEARALSEEALGLLLERVEGVGPNTTVLRPTPELPENVRAIFERWGIEVRQYPVVVVGESALAEVLRRFRRELGETTTVETNVRLCHIAPSPDGGFRLTATGKDELLDIRTKHVISCTGRKGIADTHRMLADLGIAFRDPRPSVGVRFEMSARYLRSIGRLHPDLKISRRSGAGPKVKTFCFCGGENGGRIKVTNYQDAFGAPILTLDGHETCERRRGSRELSANFGLLCQADRPVADIRAFVDRVRESTPHAARGRIAVQRLSDFRRRRAGTPVASLRAELPFEPSIEDMIDAPLHELFTVEEHAALIEAFWNVMRPILEVEGLSIPPASLEDEVLVLGPEIEFLWREPELDAFHETSVDGFFIAGDSAGIAQGIIQAMMQGIRTARTIAARTALRLPPAATAEVSR